MCFVHIREGRTASLWSWRSFGESSPDEMPDYDSMKSKNQFSRYSSQDLKHDECKYLGYDLKKNMLDGVIRIFVY